MRKIKGANIYKITNNTKDLDNYVKFQWYFIKDKWFFWKYQ